MVGGEGGQVWEEGVRTSSAIGSGRSFGQPRTFSAGQGADRRTAAERAFTSQPSLAQRPMGEPQASQGDVGWPSVHLRYAWRRGDKGWLYSGVTAYLSRAVRCVQMGRRSTSRPELASRPCLGGTVPKLGRGGTGNRGRRSAVESQIWIFRKQRSIYGVLFY